MWKIAIYIVKQECYFFNIPRYNRTRDTHRREIDFFSLEIKKIIPAYKYNVSLIRFAVLLNITKK